MKKKRANALLLIALCTMMSVAIPSILRISFAYDIGDGLVVDLFSNKAPFNGEGINQSSDAFSPLESIVIYASVTYNGEPIVSVPVALQIVAPVRSLDQYRTIETNESGIATIEFNIPWTDNVENVAFGTWEAIASVSIGGKYASDRLAFEVGWLVSASLKVVSPSEYPEPLIEKQDFVKGSEVGLEITLKNIAINIKDVTLTILVWDSWNRSIYEPVQSDFKIPHGELLLPLYKFSIPKWAATGTAKIFVNVYDPSGIPYSPERSATFNILSRDIAITRASISSTELFIGQILSISVTVKNLGSVVETFNVTVYYNGSQIETYTVAALEPNTERTLSFTWNTSEIGEGIYTITASASRVPEETNTSNNNYLIGQVRVILRRIPISQRDLYIVLFAILLLFLLALLALLVIRRRKKEPEDTLTLISYFT